MTRRLTFGLAAVVLLGLAGLTLANEDPTAPPAETGQAALEAAAAPTIDTGTTAWMLTSTALVLLMVPGLAMFYGGLVRTKNVLGTMMHCFAAMAIIGVIWMICGYAMTFGSTIKGIIGWDTAKLFLQGSDGDYYYLDEAKTTAIPELVFAMFQGKFAIITPALIAGAFAERVRFRGYCVFIALWSLLVYNPLAHIVWGGGYLTGEAIDFAGGTVIHISAGVSGLVAAIYLGARRGYPAVAMHPSNLVMTMMGAGLLWVGWFGFNAGSSVASGMQTAQALTVTQIAAAAGAVTWMVIEGIRYGKASALGMVSGILAGLVAITPAAGDVVPWGALVLGALASVFCFLAIALKNKLGYDDTLDVFGIHGVAGIIGAIMLVFFLRPDDGEPRSWADQIWPQFEGVLVSCGIAVVVTLVLVVLIDKTLGLKLHDDGEMAGLDHQLHGEHGYGLLNPE